MYILFYPLKFPSTPVLILFKVLQHHNNLFCGPKQELNLHSPVSIANTYGHVLILYPTFGSSRVCYSSLLDNLYYTPPLFRGDFTICPPGHMVGKTGLEPATPGSVCI